MGIPRRSRDASETSNQIRVTPYTILIDTREGHPYTFTGIRMDSTRNYSSLVVKTEVRTLATGDYSIDGLEDQITIERKSLADAYHTFGAGRDRFVRELERMASFAYAAVVIEADWYTAINHPPDQSKLLPKTFYRSILAWQQDYGVHFHLCGRIAVNIGGRGFAERTTFRLLDRFWRKKHHAAK